MAWWAKKMKRFQGEKWMGEKGHIIILACAECGGAGAGIRERVCVRVCGGGYACGWAGMWVRIRSCAHTHVRRCM